MSMNVNNTVNDKVKIHIKLQIGAEFEAEGSEAFVIREKNDFLRIALPGSENREMANQENKTDPAEGKSVWTTVIGFKKEIPYIIKKSSSLEAHEAALIIMAGQRALKNNDEISAINLSRALKLSGLRSKRIDREISPYIKEDKISAFGFKRNRSYKINPKGIQDAYLKAIKIAKE